MATADKDKEEAAPGNRAGAAPGSERRAAGPPDEPQRVTITLPSMANLPPLPPVQLEPKRVLWLGGLAAMGVVGVLSWPVVAAVGVGSYVAERFARSGARDEIRKAQGHKQQP
jgi:hypothetical protein